MTYNIESIFRSEDIDMLLNSDDIVAIKSEFDASNMKMQMINITLPLSMQESLFSKMGINVTNVPMRFIRGNTPSHTDVSANDFDFTYLIYLTDSVGELVLGDTSFPISKNTGFKFSEGILHETRNTENAVRVLIGPMDVNGNSVGRYPIWYFNSEEDAATGLYENIIAAGNFTIGELDEGSIGSHTHWRIKTRNGDPSNDTTVYANGATLPDDLGFTYYDLYPVLLGDICFIGDTKIKTDQGNIEISKIDNNIHTINGKKIVKITKTVSSDSYLVCFMKDALGKDYPKKKTIMSKEHKVMYNGKLLKAESFLGKSDKIVKKKNRNEFLYNILMDEYSVVVANGMVCETLDPKNILANPNLYT